MNVLTEIDSMLDRVQNGWCSHARAHTLASAVLTLRPEISVIIGVWAGRDTFAVAMAHRATGKGKVLAIDPWRCDASARDQTGDHFKFWQNTDHEKIYQEFMAFRIGMNLEQFIDVRRSVSDLIEPVQTPLLVIDGNHGPQALTDTKRFAPKVDVGGICILDDLEWPGGFVKQSVQWLLQNGFKQLAIIDTSALFQRIK